MTAGTSPPEEVRILRPGSWKKAEIRVRSTRSGTVVEKDYRGLSPLLQWYGRLQCRREERAYEILRNVATVPDLVGLRDRILAIEHVEGRAISRLMGTADGAPAYSSLEKAVAALHAAGIYHLDLRKRDNILVAEDNSVHLLDFASAMEVKPGSFLNSVIGRILGFFDGYALLKWKSVLCPDQMSTSEWAWVRWLDALRLRRTLPGKQGGG